MAYDEIEHSTDATANATAEEAAIEQSASTTVQSAEAEAASFGHGESPAGTEPAPISDPDEGAHNYGMSDDAAAASSQWFDDAARYE
jgi:hypothetical protein